MPTLLIVDEAEVVRDMLGEILEDSPYELKYAEDGTEALEIYRRGGIDVVLTDIWMEPMNGLDLLKQLNRLDPQCVVVMMTGFDRKDFILEAFRNQAFAYLEKPFEVDELNDTLDRAFRLREERAMVAKILAGDKHASPIAPSTRQSREEEKMKSVSAAMVEAEMETLQDSLIELQHELELKNKSIEALKTELARSSKTSDARGAATTNAELEQRAAELHKRESMIRDLEAMVKEREAYVEEVENSLAERCQQLQELEASLEQQSEDIESQRNNKEI